MKTEHESKTLKKIAQLLLRLKLTLGIAESCTGGLLSSWLTDIPGSSRYFLGSVVAYDNQVKNKILGIPLKIIKSNGAVSKKVAICLAQKSKSLLGADVGIGLTGIAGPGGGSPGKPIGTVFISIAIGQHLFFKKFLLKGTRTQIKKAAALCALKLLFECLT